MQVFHYATPTTPAGPGSDVTIADAVQVDPEHRFIERAALGEAAVVAVRVDDPAAAYDFRGLKRFYVVEDECPAGDQLVWNGYVNDQEISRGAGTGTLFPRGSGRRWELELEETNAILGFRVITGADGDRPAETASQRLTWLLASDYLATVFDNGLVVYPVEAMDATDYRGQTAQDVLSDLAVQTGSLFFAFYDTAAPDDRRISLFFDDPDSLAYASVARISNSGDADGATIFAPSEDTRLRRSPGRVTAGVYVQYSGGAVYQTDLDTSYEFGFRDQVAPMAEVKTEAKALALAARFLADNDEQDERIFTAITVGAADLNAIKRGQVLRARFQHLPGYADWTWFRVVEKSWAPPENRSQAWFDVDLELAPLAPAPSGATDDQHYGVAFSGIPLLPRPTTPGNLLLVAVAGGAAFATQYPADLRFDDNPPTSGSPNVPPLADHAGWTVLGTAQSDYTGMNVGGPSSTSGQIAGFAYRPVAPGEVTTTPVQVSTDVSTGEAGAWLWEFASGGAPTLVGTKGRTNMANPGHATLPGGTGHLLALFVFTQVDYGNPPYSTTPDAGNRIVRACRRDNNPQGSPGIVDDGTQKPWEGPWAVIVELPDGGNPGVTLQAISAYTSLNYCGVVIRLPSSAAPDGVPDIPYPANQTA